MSSTLRTQLEITLNFSILHSSAKCAALGAVTSLNWHKTMPPYWRYTENEQRVNVQLCQEILRPSLFDLCTIHAQQFSSMRKFYLRRYTAAT